MGKIIASPEIDNVPGAEAKIRYIQLFLNNVLEQINGNLEITENLKIKLQIVKFTSANVNKAIPHGLGVVPQGYIVCGKSAASVEVYDGTVVSTKNLIYLRSAAVGTANILFF